MPVDFKNKPARCFAGKHVLGSNRPSPAEKPATLSSYRLHYLVIYVNMSVRGVELTTLSSFLLVSACPPRIRPAPSGLPLADSNR
jgi:hypothetical protein